jgi:Gpi18-like mannosyltransferase
MGTQLENSNYRSKSKRKVELLGRLTNHENIQQFSLLFFGAVLALVLRVSLHGFKTEDYLHYFGPWYDFIREHGWSALGMKFSNYTPLYLYMLYGISAVLPKLSSVNAIKIPSIMSDFICAWYVYRIVRMNYKSGLVPILAFYAVLFAPTVVLNGAAWGQIEGIFTAALVAGLYYLLNKKHGLAFTAFGIAFAVKFQAIYLAPFLIALLIKKIIPWKYTLLIPAVYFLSILPAWWTGRPLWELLTLYSTQASAFPGLVANAPSMYVFFTDQLSKTIFPAGIIYCASICFIYAVIVYRTEKAISRHDLILLALLSSILVPYFLPKTHDRYFYTADVLSILFAFHYIRFYYVPLLMNMASFFTYQYYLFYDYYPAGRIDIPLPTLALTLLGLIVILARLMILRFLLPGQELLED